MKALALLSILLAAGCGGSQAEPKKVVYAVDGPSFSCTSPDYVGGWGGTSGPYGTGTWKEGHSCIWFCASLDGAPPAHVEIALAIASAGNWTVSVDRQPTCSGW